MKQQLRVVAEVAGVGIVAQLAGTVLATLIMLPFSWLRVGPRWFMPALGMLNLVICPCCAGLIYGLRRRLPLHLAAVSVGWMVGWLVYSMLMGATILRDVHTRHHKPAPLGTWAVWLLETLGMLVLLSLLPMLATMWGQRLRLRAAQPGD